MSPILSIHPAASQPVTHGQNIGEPQDVKDGQWGYRLMVIADPDGNELYFPYPTSLATGSLITSNPEQPR